MRTSVAIIGAGPAGLVLSQLLARQGIDSVVLESRSRAHVEQRQRAGILEHGTAQLLRDSGAGHRMDQESLVHNGIELRFAGEGHRIDFAELTGRSVLVYAQTEVVRDLIELRLAAGGQLLFEAPATEITGIHSAEPAVRFRQDGAEHVLTADVVVAADGYHGIGRASIPADALRTWERDYPFAWLGVTAAVPPSTEELIYCHSPRGFALHSMRSLETSRLYLQVPPGADPSAWSDERIWHELDLRFAKSGWKLDSGPIVEQSVTPMRSFVAEPMRHGQLFLAGDAAHIVPPTGAKGLNLAVADVTVLADALSRWYTSGDTAGLDSYSATALRRVWRAQHFSYFMTTLLHVDPTADDYARRLQLAHLDYVASSHAAATSLAENYTGLPLAR
ncbi:p-hydroxybenzoate 3-monooxygenase [Tamaricihabitans halophyticus]|uniref:p-hydroxybenzoate 3-monooxygenase n=1 Tax=Tamaricihabitans halophyticus TaxID=1262583 RepID=A0A4R2Q4X4_9PSEU|nr:4-hydroxybenzoate 3-monooxygenase [Tamaricihabitans halophyticus]TCP43863.1 p-hydroxybenzoate 3-monooxygenase [Tamaricihabitans halophyticus]